MNPELLGMSNEELIQWAVQHGAVDEKELRWQMPSIEHYCAQNPIGLPDFVAHLVSLVNDGIKVKPAVKRLMDYYKRGGAHERTFGGNDA